jgi:hypothetical protein
LYELSGSLASCRTFSLPRKITSQPKVSARIKIRKGKIGRPAVMNEVRDLTRRMSRENAGWGAPRISRRTAQARHRYRRGQCEKVPGAQPETSSLQTWRTFLKNHVQSLVSVFTVPTIRFQILSYGPPARAGRKRCARLNGRGSFLACLDGKKFSK